jgi:hypothetical protein
MDCQKCIIRIIRVRKIRLEFEVAQPLGKLTGGIIEFLPGIRGILLASKLLQNFKVLELLLNALDFIYYVLFKLESLEYLLGVRGVVPEVLVSSLLFKLGDRRPALAYVKDNL